MCNLHQRDLSAAKIGTIQRAAAAAAVWIGILERRCRLHADDVRYELCQQKWQISSPEDIICKSAVRKMNCSRLEFNSRLSLYLAHTRTRPRASIIMNFPT